MGYGQSKEESKDTPLSSRFSTMELRKLEEYFNFKENVSGSDVDVINNISVRSIMLSPCVDMVPNWSIFIFRLESPNASQNRYLKRF